MKRSGMRASIRVHGRRRASRHANERMRDFHNRRCDDKRSEDAMDARTSRYHEVYARWQRDPEGFWGEAAQAIDWIEPPKNVFDPNAGVYGRWFPGGVCNTCYNAVDRHVEPAAASSRRSSTTRRSPAPSGPSPTPSCRPRPRRSPACCKDFGVSKGDRVILYMPMVPEAVVAHARLRAHRRDPFGGVRRLRGEGARHPHRRRQAEGDPLGELRHRGRPRRRLQAAARRGDRAREAQARGLPHPAAAAARSAS